MIEIPSGKTVRDMLPQYSNVTTEYGPFGAPCKTCAGCSEPFTSNRKPKMSLRLYLAQGPLPIISLFRICGQCTRRYRASGIQRDRVLDAVEKFFLGES